MEYPEEQYYKLNRFFLSASGLWPYQDVRNARLIRAIFTVILLSSVLFQVSSILTSGLTIELIIDLAPAVGPTFGSLLHMYAHAIYIDELKELLDRMCKDWALKKTDDEIKIMRDNAGTSRLLTIYFSLQTYIIILGYFVWTFMPEILQVISPMNESRPRTQPFKVEYFINEEKYFYLIRSHICIVIFLSSIIFVAACTTFLTVTQHVCGMYELLGYRAERLFCIVENAKEFNDFTCGTKISCKNIIVLIRLHTSVIQFVSLIETFHTIPFLLDFTGIAVALSFMLTQILCIAGNLDRAVRSISFTFIQIYYIFICNYMGQKVTDMNWNVCEKMYNSTWYDTVTSEQKSLLLIMKQTFRPLVLTACKFYVLSLQNFEMILQTAVSYCMFVRQI